MLYISILLTGLTIYIAFQYSYGLRLPGYRSNHLPFIITPFFILITTLFYPSKTRFILLKIVISLFRYIAAIILVATTLDMTYHYGKNIIYNSDEYRLETKTGFIGPKRYVLIVKKGFLQKTYKVDFKPVFNCDSIAPLYCVGNKIKIIGFDQNDNIDSLTLNITWP